MTCSRSRVHTIAFPLLALALAVGPVAADEQEGRHRDNSGRQIAVVVPGMPHVPAPGVVPTPTSVPVHRWVPGQPTRKAGKAEKAATQSYLPAELNPNVKDAIQKGTDVAQGFQKVAVKRAGDVAVWVTTMWQQLNDTPPRITPVTDYAPPAPPMDSMKPIAEPNSRERQLYYTNERRLKTVVAQ